MRVLIPLVAVLLPGLASALDLRPGPCPYDPRNAAARQPVDCLLDARGTLRAALYPSTNGATQDVVVYEPGQPPRTLTTDRALGFHHVSPAVLAQIEGTPRPAAQPPATPLPHNPPRALAEALRRCG